MRTVIDGVTVDLVSYTRIVNRLERRAGRWAVLSLDCVYERDTLTPAVPGTTVTIPPAELAAYRSPYALLAWHLARRGYEVSTGLLGDDRPEQRDAFYAESLQWLRG